MPKATSAQIAERICGKERAMNNTDRHPECHMRTALGNCDPIGGFCTSVNESICEALHKVSRPQGKWINKGAVCQCTRCKGYSRGLLEEKNGKLCEPHRLIYPWYCPNCGARMIDKDIDVSYKIASDQRDYDSTYEPTYNEQDGSM